MPILHTSSAGFCCLLLLTAPLHGEQIDIVNEVKVIPNGWQFFTFTDQMPANWCSPINYYDDYKLHLRVEVLEKTTKTALTTQIGFFFNALGGKGEHHMTYYQGFPAITGPGVYEQESSPVSGIWAPTTGEIKRRLWESGVAKIVFEPRALNGGRLLAPGEFPGQLADYLPITIHIQVTLLPKGATFEPPGSYGGMKASDLSALKHLADHWTQGRLGAVHSATVKLVGDADAVRADEAKRALAALDRYADGQLQALTRLKEQDPVIAVERLGKLALRFSGSARGTALLDTGKAWEKEPATIAAQRASALWAQAERSAQRLATGFGGKKASDPEAQRFAADLKMIQQAATALRGQYPTAPATRRALALAELYAIPLPVAESR